MTISGENGETPAMTIPAENGEVTATTISGEGAAEPRRDWASSLLGRLGVSAPHLLLILLAEVWLLNVADLLLTRYVLRLGFATESNVVMDYFIRQGHFAAGAFKMGIVTVGVLLLWLLRRRAGVMLGAVLLTGVFAAVVAYQAAWIVGH
jgi:hypothetical protein